MTGTTSYTSTAAEISGTFTSSAASVGTVTATRHSGWPYITGGIAFCGTIPDTVCTTYVEPKCQYCEGDLLIPKELCRPCQDLKDKKLIRHNGTKYVKYTEGEKAIDTENTDVEVGIEWALVSTNISTDTIPTWSLGSTSVKYVKGPTTRVVEWTNGSMMKTQKYMDDVLVEESYTTI